MCEDACPEVFRLDDEGELEILMESVPPELARKVESAVRLCPVAALRILKT
jgi:ferredoxin